MQAHMNLKVKTIGVTRMKGMEQESGKRFSGLGRFLKKSVSFYQDENLRKVGSPFIWTE